MSNIQVLKPQIQVVNTNLKVSSSNVKTHGRRNANFLNQSFNLPVLYSRYLVPNSCRRNADFSILYFKLQVRSPQFNLKSYTSRFQVYGGIRPDFQVSKFNPSTPWRHDAGVFKIQSLISYIQKCVFSISKFKLRVKFKFQIHLQVTKTLSFYCSPVQNSKYFQRVENPLK